MTQETFGGFFTCQAFCFVHSGAANTIYILEVVSSSFITAASSQNSPGPQLTYPVPWCWAFGLFMVFCSSEKRGSERVYVPSIVLLGQRLNTFLVMCKAKPGVGEDSSRVVERRIGGTRTLKERLEVLGQAPCPAPSTPMSLGFLPPRCCLVSPHSHVYSRPAGQLP